MNKILNAVLLIAVFLVLAVSFSYAAGDAVKGKESYDNICASCHGPGGKGDGVAAAALDPKPRDLSDPEYVSGLSNEHLTKVISKGGTSVGLSALMPAWEGVLQPEDITNVIEYIHVDICKCQPK
ncbi:MAG: c-type cytochrome [Thermodesulfobacteriota bacterium]